MARKQPNIPNRMLLTWFTLAGFILLFAPHKLTNNFQLAFAHVFRMPLNIGRSISLSSRVPQSPAEAFKQKETQYQNYIANLEEELRQEREKLDKLSAIRKNNRRALEGAGLVYGEIITSTINKSRCELTINRGSDEGLAEGQYVLGDNSIIGVISQVWLRTATVRLITDPKSKIAAKISDLNVARIMEGNGENSAVIRLIKSSSPKDTIVYADKTPGFLDSPLVSAKIVECTRNPQSPVLWNAIVKPACEITNLKDIAVIIMNPQNQAEQ